MAFCRADYVHGTECGTGRYWRAAGQRPGHSDRGLIVFDCAGISAPRRLAKGSAMATLISVLITFVVIILVLYLVNMLPIDGRAKHIVRIIVVIIGILSLLRYLAVF
jgi:hypothetical protein